MIDFVRRSVACAAIVAGAVLAPAAVASAAATVPFQIDPAPFGNPNGSLDVPSIRCWAVVGEQPGTVTITGPKDGLRMPTPGRHALAEPVERSLRLRPDVGRNGRIPGSDPADRNRAGRRRRHTPGGPYTPGVVTVYVP